MQKFNCIQFYPILLNLILPKVIEHAFLNFCLTILSCLIPFHDCFLRFESLSKVFKFIHNLISLEIQMKFLNIQTNVDYYDKFEFESLIIYFVMLKSGFILSVIYFNFRVFYIFLYKILLKMTFFVYFQNQTKLQTYIFFLVFHNLFVSLTSLSVKQNTHILT